MGGVWTKTLHYLEQSVAHWLMRGGAMAVMVPAVDADSIVKRCDVDLCALRPGARRPGAAGRQRRRRPELRRNAAASRLGRRQRARPLRDGAGRAFVKAGKPVFGVCRGLQLLNVMPWRHAVPGHRDAGARFAGAPRRRTATTGTSTRSTSCPARGWRSCTPRVERARVNSIHHQGIKDLAPDFEVEARCPDDGMVEAIRRARPRLRGRRAVAPGVPQHRGARQPGRQRDAQRLPGRRARQPPRHPARAARTMQPA